MSGDARAGRTTTEDVTPEEVVLPADRRGMLARSLRALADLPPDLPEHALVGGLAVMVRLAEAHRVTTDFDEVSRGRDDAIQLLLDQGATRTSSGVLLPEGQLRLDLLDAETDFDELEAAAATVGTDHERQALELALVSRFGLETARPTEIVVVDDARTVADVTIPVATAGALVAMKVVAARSRDRTPEKAATDVYDTFRLVRSRGPGPIAAEIAPAPPRLRRAVSAHVRHLFDRDLDRTLRRLRQSAVPGVETARDDDLAALAVLADVLEAGLPD